MALLVAAILAVTIFRVQDHLAALLNWVETFGIWGPVVFAFAYIVASLVFFPGSLMTMAAGFTFGPLIGTITVSIGATLGATAAFLAGRTIARPLVEQWVSEHPRFRSLDHAVAERGFLIVLLTRLSPVFPFTLLNYAFGLTKVRLWQYVLASWIGMLPGGVMYIYIGSTIQHVSDLLTGHRQTTVGEQVLFFSGLAVTVLVTILVTRLATRALKETAPEVLPEEAGRQAVDR